MILEYINKKGVLENYHSFNYEIINNELKLKEILITPYMDMVREDLNRFINIKEKA